MKILISKNQIELLNIVQSFRFIPQRAVLEIVKNLGLYRYRQSLGFSIRKLEEVGYLNSFLYGNNWKVLYITKKGADRLSFELGVPRDLLHVPGQNQRVQFSTLEHTLEITEIFCSVSKAVTSLHNFKISKWLGDQSLRCKYQFRTPTGKKTTKFLVPDSYFILQIQNTETSYFLEYDTGTMDIEQLSLKFQRYFEYFYYGDWKEKFGSFPKLLFLTLRSKQQLDNLLVSDSNNIDIAIRNRSLFTNSKNLLWRSIGKTPNIRTINSIQIKEFLNLKFNFYQYKDLWINDLLKQS